MPAPTTALERAISSASTATAVVANREYELFLQQFEEYRKQREEERASEYTVISLVQSVEYFEQVLIPESLETRRKRYYRLYRKKHGTTRQKKMLPHEYISHKRSLYLEVPAREKISTTKFAPKPTAILGYRPSLPKSKRPVICPPPIVEFIGL